jgi:hypothetical protein
MREEYEIYLTVFAQQLSRDSSSAASSPAGGAVWTGISKQAAATVAVLDVKLVEQGKREDARSYSSFVGEIERLRYAMPTAPSSAS